MMKGKQRFKAPNCRGRCVSRKFWGARRLPAVVGQRRFQRAKGAGPHLACNASPARTDGGLVVANFRDSCYKTAMETKLTAVFRKFPEGYAAFIEELPGANTQGATLEEARAHFDEYDVKRDRSDG